jgi:hypothetical protein
MRYPLVLITVLQAGIAFKLGAKRSLFAAVTLAIIFASFSFILVVNPNPNWYGVCLALIIGYVLENHDTQRTRTILLVGFLVGIIFLFRQITGVFLALAVTTILFSAHSKNAEKGHSLAGSIILATLCVTLSLYLLSSAKFSGLLLLGICPVIVLAIAAARCKLAWKPALLIIVKLLAGAAISAVPIILYHLVNGSLSALIDDVLLSVLTLTKLPLFESYTYPTIIAQGLAVLKAGEISAIVGIVFWAALLFAPLLLGISVIRRMFDTEYELPVLGIIALFHALIAVMIEAPYYIFYISALVLAAIVLAANAKKPSIIAPIVCIILSICAVYYHAAQPLERGYANMVANQRINVDWQKLPNNSVYVTRQDATKYEHILNLIERCAGKDDLIYSPPINAEINFLSKRKAPFKYLNSGFALQAEANVNESIQRLNSNDTIAMVFYRELDGSNTGNVQTLIDGIKTQYSLLKKYDDLAIYVRNSKALKPTCHPNQ